MDKILTIDLGNTSTHLVFWQGNSIITETRVDTEKDNLSNYETKLLEATSNFVFNEVYIASVVPICCEVVKKVFPKAKVLKFDDIDDLDFSKMNRDVSGMGPDRLAVMKAVWKPGQTRIVFDLGTASNIEILKGNQYQGGLIIPGYQITINALISNASLLSELKPEIIEPTLTGHTLEEQIFGAHMQAQIAMLEGLMQKYIALYKDVDFYFTGGYSNILSPYLQITHIHDPYLVHKGLRKIYE